MRTLALAVLAVSLASAGMAQDTATEAKATGSALIDQHLKLKWDEAGLKPAKRADDAEWMRRVSLDLVGVIPSHEEAEKFLADRNSNKREKFIDMLLKEEAYAEHWADVWSGILVGFDNERRDVSDRNEEHKDLREIFHKNMPYDEFARKVITVSGAVFDRGQARLTPENMKELPQEVGLASYITHQQRVAGKDFALAMAGKVTRVFMGVQIQCAQCHDHPFDKWTQEEFYGMAGFFTGLAAENRNYVPPEDKGKDKKDLKKVEIRYNLVHDRGDSLSGVGRDGKKGAGNGQMMMAEDGRDLAIPNAKGGPVKTAFLETGKGVEPGVRRRETFAKYVTSKDNAQFAKMAVNRYWAHFFGVGIVNPCDDFNGRNKPSHPELLNDLARDFADHGYNVQWLIKVMTMSQAYNLTSAAKGKERDPQALKMLALARVRPLTPEQILRSVYEATNLGEGPVGRRMGFGKGGKTAPKGAPPGAAGEDPRERMIMQAVGQFRYAFGDDEGAEVGEFAGTIPSALLMMNSQLLSNGTSANRMNGFGELLAKHPNPADRIRVIFLSVLSRYPTSAESSRWSAHMGKAGGDKGYEDLIWTLLNTSEFLFNH
jgi:hypothetical protein